MSRPKDNDFSDKVKNLAGRSVGFRCCFPECNRLLVSRKKNSIELINIAEYAHIAAASPGGPRYDSSLSSEEIKSYDNCIVMCGSHHHIIDTDPVEYNTEKLKEWKSIAEERTRQEVLNPRNVESDEELEAIFQSLLKTGDYDILNTKINDFKDIQNHNLNEIVMRYNIIVNNIFRKDCHDVVESYVNLGYKNIDEVVLYLIEFNNKKEIEYLIESITNDDLKYVAHQVVNCKTDDLIKNPDISVKLKSLKSGIQIKFIMNYIFTDSNQFCDIYDMNGNKQEFCKDDYYYEFLSFVLMLREKCLVSADFLSKDTVINDISKYIEMIDKYSGEIKLNIYKFILIYLAITNSEMFKYYYDRLSKEEQSKKEIADIYYGYMIEKKCPILVDEILDYSTRVNDYKALLAFLASNPNITKEFLEEHKYLLKKDSAFLMLYRRFIEKDKFIEELKGFQELYSEDFMYNCLRWNYNLEDNSLKTWCINNEDKLSNFSIEIYLANLIMSHENNQFFNMVKRVRDIDLKANYLLMFHHYNQNSHEYDDMLLTEYNVINDSKKILGINHNLAIMYWNKGDYDKAFECLYCEIDTFDSHSSMQLLFNFRLEKERYIKDKYFQKALLSNNYYELIYVAEVYYHNNELEDALDYYEKALITGVNKAGCLFKIFELTNKHSVKSYNEVSDNTAVTINSFDDKMTIVFHRKSILEGINDKNTEWIDACLYSEPYCDFMYCSVGDIITINGKEYKIDAIEDIYSYYSKLFLRDLTLNPTIITIGGPVEEAVKKIKEITQQRYDYRKRLNDQYLEVKDRLPLSISSKLFFENKLFYNLLFLLKESPNKLINNLKILNGKIDKVKLLFYYDALFVLFNIYEKYHFDINENYCISDYVKNRLINEINNELNDINLNDGSLSMDSKGKMILYGKNNITRKHDSKYLIHLKEFVNKFKEIKSKRYSLVLNEQKLEFDEFKMEDEKSIMSIADGDESYIIVSENGMLNFLCDSKRIANIGITQMIGEVVPSEKIYEVAIMLKNMNYNNYFTYNMYLSSRNNNMIDFMNMKFDNEADNYKHSAILQAVLHELYTSKTMDLIKDSQLINYLLNENNDRNNA